MHDVCGDVEIERSTANLTFCRLFLDIFLQYIFKRKKLTVSKYSFKNPPQNDFSSEKFLF